VCRRSSLLTGEGREGVSVELIIRPHESLALCKWFNTLWFFYLSLEVEVDEGKNKDEQDKGEKSCAQATENVDNSQSQPIDFIFSAPCIIHAKSILLIIGQAIEELKY
jgi:hypothetical protein